MHVFARLCTARPISAGMRMNMPLPFEKTVRTDSAKPATSQAVSLRSTQNNDARARKSVPMFAKPDMAQTDVSKCWPLQSNRAIRKVPNAFFRSSLIVLYINNPVPISIALAKMM